MTKQMLLFLAGIILTTACKPVASPENSCDSAPDALPPPLTVAQILAQSPARPTTGSHLEPASPSPTVTPVAPLTVTPSSTPTETTHHYAPKGIFFLIKQVSIETDDGIIGLPPGSRVTKLSDGSFLGHGQRLHLTTDQYTNDLDLAESIAGKDAVVQEAIKNAVNQGAAN